MECNDHDAFSYMACMYGLGASGLPQDGPKAVKLFEKAIELGSVVAHNHLGHMYDKGDVLKEDKKKAKYHYELAAIGGSEESRWHLGRHEVEEGNMARAIKHLMLGAGAGDDDCMEMIKDGFMGGVFTKDVYEKAIRAHGACRNEMKSDDREKAAAIHKEMIPPGTLSIAELHS